MESRAVVIMMGARAAGMQPCPWLLRSGRGLVFIIQTLSSLLLELLSPFSSSSSSDSRGSRGNSSTTGILSRMYIGAASMDIRHIAYT